MRAKCQKCGYTSPIKDEYVNENDELKELNEDERIVCPNCTTLNGCLEPVDLPPEIEILPEVEENE